MLELNTDRIFTVPVSIVYVDEDGKDQQGVFKATYRLPGKDLSKPENKGKSLLDIALVSVDELKLTDSEGQELEGEELLMAAKLDHTLHAALTRTFMENNTKKPQTGT